MSRRQAALHFDVWISTVISWARRFRETGSVLPGKMGGHKPKAIGGEHRAFLLDRTRGKDFTLARARGRTRRTRPQGIDYRTGWNFVRAEKLSFKKTYGPPRLQVI